MAFARRLHRERSPRIGRSCTDGSRLLELERAKAQSQMMEDVGSAKSGPVAGPRRAPLFLARRRDLQRFLA
eukprot:3198243-Pyramimonas_sp.AAC.1